MNTYAQISVSQDGFIAGPNPTLTDPLGVGGEQLHQWVVKLRAWREPHGLEGGEDEPVSAWLDEIPSRTGAYVMGRKMFSGGSGPWADDPNANGWWGAEPPFAAPVFVLTHHEREPLTLGATTFHFVTDGFAAAHARAVEAAGGRDVQIAGGGEALRQAIEAGVLDELRVHTRPVDLGSGTPLPTVSLEEVERIDARDATHVRYRVMR